MKRTPMKSPAPKVLLDTNVWSRILRQDCANTLHRLNEFTPAQVLMSPIVWGELIVGYEKGDKSARRLQALKIIEKMSTHLPLDHRVSLVYGQLRAALEKDGRSIGRNDTWIAAEALQHKAILVTENQREFERVPDLLLQNWHM